MVGTLTAWTVPLDVTLNAPQETTDSETESGSRRIAGSPLTDSSQSSDFLVVWRLDRTGRSMPPLLASCLEKQDVVGRVIRTF